MGEDPTTHAYKATLQSASRILGNLRPAVLVLNAAIPIDWGSVEELLLDLGYCLLRFRTSEEKEATGKRLARRASTEYVALVAQEADYGRLQEELSGLCDARYSYVFLFPNNPRQYAAWSAKPREEVKRLLAANQDSWRAHCAATDGNCFTLLL